MTTSSSAFGGTGILPLVKLNVEVLDMSVKDLGPDVPSSVGLTAGATPIYARKFSS